MHRNGLLPPMGEENKNSPHSLFKSPTPLPSIPIYSTDCCYEVFDDTQRLSPEVPADVH